MKVMGVLGGLGPEATHDFFGKVLRATGAKIDQEHLPILIHNDPRTPCRNQALAGTGPSPGPALAKAAANLEGAGADFLVMPCNAAHHWLDEIRAAIEIPFLSIIDATVESASQKSAHRIGLLAADACLAAHLYPPALEKRGITAKTLPPAGQRRFMELLAQIKTGDTGERMQSQMKILARELGQQTVIAACTEVPLVLDGNAAGFDLISSTDCLVDAAVRCATSRANER